VVGTAQPVRVSEAVGLILKAFAAGCSALTGIEAIANGVPVFRQPRARRAQRAELMLGALLGAMLIGMEAGWPIATGIIQGRAGISSPTAST